MSVSLLRESDLTLDMKSTGTTAKRILVVDDVPTNRKMLRKLLDKRGHYVDEAENGIIAVEMVKTATTNILVSSSSSGNNDIHKDKGYGYDAILMDYVMPKMNGPDATKAIRQLGYTGPIIGVTGNALPEDREVFMNAGATDVIIKPLRLPVLLNIIDV